MKFVGKRAATLKTSTGNKKNAEPRYFTRSALLVIRLLLREYCVEIYTPALTTMGFCFSPNA